MEISTQEDENLTEEGLIKQIKNERANAELRELCQIDHEAHDYQHVAKEVLRKFKVTLINYARMSKKIDKVGPYKQNFEPLASEKLLLCDIQGFSYCKWP